MPIKRGTEMRPGEPVITRDDADGWLPARVVVDHPDEQVVAILVPEAPGSKQYSRRVVEHSDVRRECPDGGGPQCSCRCLGEGGQCASLAGLPRA